MPLPTLNRGEVRPFFGTATADSGTLTVTGQPTYTLYDSTGAVVAGYNAQPVDDFDATAAASVRAWVSLDTSALVVGTYTLVFTLSATGSDSIARTYLPSTTVTVGTPTGGHLFGSELYTFLLAAGLLEDPLTTQQAALDFQGAVDAAYAEFERRTRFVPFLSDGTIRTRTFRVESNCVPFIGGLISLDSGADAISSGTYNYILGTNCQLLPVNNPALGRPYTYLRFGMVGNSGLFTGEWPGADWYGGFAGYLGFVGQQVSVRGVWGYSLTLPGDVKQAVLAYAAALLAPQLALQVSGGLYSERRLNAETRYGGGGITPFSSERIMWKSVFESVVLRYRAYQ